MATVRNPLTLLLGEAVLLLLGSLASAQDSFEIEVYGSETLQRHETAVELHSNFNVESEDTPNPQQYPSQHSLNESVEIAHGFTDWFQGSFYLLTSINTAYGWQWAGDRVRPQVRIPESWHRPVGLSLSTELSYQPPRFSPDTWTAELLPIIDKKIGRWYFAFNPTIDRSLRGCEKAADEVPVRTPPCSGTVDLQAPI
jgi:hypothetical protein